MDIISPAGNLNQFSAAVFLRGFSNRGYLANGGMPSVTLYGSYYSISKVNANSPNNSDN